MITLDEAISFMEAQIGEIRGVTGVVLYADEICEYLKQYRDIRSILPDKCISYFGKLPVVQVDDKYFAVREYIPDRKAWRCHQVEVSPITGTWVCNDDDNWIISNTAEILYREVGWDLREIPYEKKDSE